MIQLFKDHAQHRSRFLEKTLHSIAETLERSLFAEGISAQKGFLQSLDPRVKVVFTLALLIAAGLSKNLAAIAGIYALVLLLAWRSAIPLGVFLRRVWLALPFFTGLIALPALFITPGPTLASLPFGLVITRTGMNTALFLLLRVSTSLSLTLLLILTTSWNTVLSALSVLHIPEVFLLVLGMTYRYIYLLMHMANDMFLSRQSRVVGYLPPAEERNMMAAAGATLLGKSLDMSSEVYLAMQSRGFRGKMISIHPFQMQFRDWFWLTIFMLIAFLAIVLGQF